MTWFSPNILITSLYISGSNTHRCTRCQSDRSWYKTVKYHRLYIRRWVEKVMYRQLFLIIKNKKVSLSNRFLFLIVYPTKYKDIIRFEDSRFVQLQSFANFSKYKEESDFTVIVTMQVGACLSCITALHYYKLTFIHLKLLMSICI